MRFFADSATSTEASAELIRPKLAEASVSVVHYLETIQIGRTVKDHNISLQELNHQYSEAKKSSTPS